MISLAPNQVSVARRKLGFAVIDTEIMAPRTLFCSPVAVRLKVVQSEVGQWPCTLPYLK